MVDSVSLANLALDLGFIPISLNGKRPILRKWQRITAKTAINHIKDEGDNIGILTGKPSGIVVVDVDIKNDGLEYWQELINKYDLPSTFTVQTGGGGRHYYFNYDERTQTLRNSSRTINGKGIDLKTNGGQVVFPGSIHPETGEKYAIIEGVNFTEEGDESIIIASMPDWLFDLFAKNKGN